MNARERFVRWLHRLAYGDTSPRQQPTFPCPHCGAAVPEHAISCRECGSDDDTGWSAAAQSSLWIGDSDADAESYDDDGEAASGRTRFGERTNVDRRSWLSWHAWTVRILLLLIIVATLLQMFY